MWNNKVGRYGNKHHKSRQVLSISWLYQNPHTTSHLKSSLRGHTISLFEGFPNILNISQNHCLRSFSLWLRDLKLYMEWTLHCLASDRDDTTINIIIFTIILAIFLTFIPRKCSYCCYTVDAYLDIFGAQNIQKFLGISYNA